MQAQQRDRGAGISRGRRRILKWLASSRQSTQLQLLFQRCFGVEEAAVQSSSPKRRNHLVGDALRKVEIAHRAGDFVGVETGESGERVIIEQAAHVALAGLRIGVGDHVRQAALVVPRLSQNAVERAQRELARIVQIKHLRRLQVRRDAHGIPAHVHRLVDERRRSLQTRRVQLCLRRGEQIERLALLDAESRGDFFRQSAHPQHVLRRVVVHLADRLDVVVQSDGLELFVGQHGLRFVDRPGEVIAVIVEVDVGILRRRRSRHARGR